MTADLSSKTLFGRKIRKSEPDSRALRDALGCFATGVTVVTGMAGDGLPFGLTVNSFSALSLEPPLILWSLRYESPLAPCLAVDSPFAVNVLRGDQVNIARRFASRQADRFAGVDWRRNASGNPAIEGAIARFDCRVSRLLPAGDHLLVIGAVESCITASGDPLLFLRGEYRDATAASLHAAAGPPGPCP